MFTKMKHIINTKNYEEFHKIVDNKPLQYWELVDIVGTNDTYFVEYAVAKGIDIHYIDNWGWSLLFWASAPVIPILVKYGLDINHVDMNGYSALMGQGYGDIACELIRNGCDINIIANHDVTALSLAITQNNFKLVELLIEKGAIGIQTTLYRLIKANQL